MAKEPHAFWPSKGSTWQHWSDLLLAMQLAALRAGFNYVGSYWDSRRAAGFRVKCTVGPSTRRTTRCGESLLNATAVNHEDLKGAWKVTEVCGGKLTVEAHAAHTVAMGTSSWLEDKPVGRTRLEPGDTLVGFRALHTLEGTLRAAARRDGHFLTVGTVIGSSTGPQEFSFTCVLDAARCNFLVKFSDIDELPKGAVKGKERWTCVEIRSEHTCVSSAAEPQERLLWRMDFYGRHSISSPLSRLCGARADEFLDFQPPIRLVDGHTGKPTRANPSAQGSQVTQRDKSFGPWPVRDRSLSPQAETPADMPEPQRSPPASPLPSPTAADPLAEQRAALLRDEGDLVSAEEALSTATRRVDEQLRLVDEQRQLVDEQRRLVEKQRRLVQKKRRRLDEAWEEHSAKLKKEDSPHDGERVTGPSVEPEPKPLEVLVLSDSE